MQGELQSRLEAVSRQLGQLQLAVLALLELARRPSVTLQVEHLDVDRLEFHIDSIDVNELSGQLNIGMTAMNRGPGQGGQGPGAQGPGQGPPGPPGAPRQIIWPPPQSKEGSPADGPDQPDHTP